MVYTQQHYALWSRVTTYAADDAQVKVLIHRDALQTRVQIVCVCVCVCVIHKPSAFSHKMTSLESSYSECFSYLTLGYTRNTFSSRKGICVFLFEYVCFYTVPLCIRLFGLVWCLNHTTLVQPAFLSQATGLPWLP